MTARIGLLNFSAYEFFIISVIMTFESHRNLTGFHSSHIIQTRESKNEFFLVTIQISFFLAKKKEKYFRLDMLMECFTGSCSTRTSISRCPCQTASPSLHR